MSEAPKRRWFQFTLRGILFWHVPYVALMWVCLFAPGEIEYPDDFYDPLGIKQNVVEGVVMVLRVNAAALITLVWLLVPLGARVAMRLWRQWRSRPATHR